VLPVLAVSEEVPLVFVPAMPARPPWPDGAVSAGHHVLDVEPGTGARRSPAGTGYAR
jgi:hypothetical protein